MKTILSLFAIFCFANLGFSQCPGGVCPVNQFPTYFVQPVFPQYFQPAQVIQPVEPVQIVQPQVEAYPPKVEKEKTQIQKANFEIFDRIEKNQFSCL